MVGSDLAAGISPTIYFNRTGENKTKQNMIFTPLTRQLILSDRRWLQVVFPAASLPKLWHGSQPGPSSCVPSVTGKAAAAGERDGVRRQHATGAEHGRAGTSCPGVPQGSHPTTGTLSRFPEMAPAPADPCGFPPAAASQPPLPNVRGRGAKSGSREINLSSLAALGLCSGLIGGSGSSAAPLPLPHA